MRKARFRRRFPSHPGAAGATAVTATVMTLCTLVSGCGTLDAADIEARQYRQAEFEAQFRDYRRRCLARGGQIVIDARRGLARDGLPNRGDRYACV